MFCPACGLDNQNQNQFCRACGANLTIVRSILEKPDAITASAANAREEIGRAFAQRIRETEDASELKIVAEDVLPKIEDFLASPEEKRLKRMRIGTIVAAVGLGVTILLFLIGLSDGKGYFMAAAGLIPFFVGISLFLNGLLFTIPNKMISDKFDEAENQRQLDGLPTNELKLPEAGQNFVSVVENTTRNLQDKELIRSKK